MFLSRHLAVSAVVQGLLLRRQRELHFTVSREQKIACVFLLALSLSRAVFLFFQMHCINKAVSLAQKCFKDCKVCWECFRNVEQCWLLSFAFQQSSRFWAPCRSLIKHTGPCNQCSKRMSSLSLWHTHTQCNILMYAFLCGYSQNCSCNMMLLFSTCAPEDSSSMLLMIYCSTPV